MLLYSLPPELIPSWLIGIPSTTTNACVFPVKELLPLITILEPAPIVPDCVMLIPATLPTNELARLWSLIVLTCSAVISDTE